MVRVERFWVCERPAAYRYTGWHWMTLLFVGLRLSGHIDWSWWWVLSPFLLLTTVEILIMLAIGWKCSSCGRRHKNPD